MSLITLAGKLQNSNGWETVEHQLPAQQVLAGLPE